MISTVTTTVTTVATLAFGAALGALGVTLLISLLVAREIATADTRRSLRLFGRNLDIGILPLLISFTLIVVFKALEILS